MKKSFFLISLFFIVLKTTSQENYEIQVYGASTMTKGVAMIELHSNFTLQGEKNIQKGVLPSYHALHETLEITQGITENFELGLYIFTNYTYPYGYKIIGTHLRPRISAPQSWKLPVGISLSAEFGYQSQEYSAQTWSFELRPIIDKIVGNWYFSFNPTLSIQIKGIEKETAPALSPNVKASFSFSPYVSVGSEYYGNLGALNHFASGQNQSHALFVVADLTVDPKWEINFGPGWGLTSATDGLVIKLLIGRKIQWRQDKHLMQQR